MHTLILVMAGFWAAAAPGPHRMEITLEKRAGEAWKAVDPSLVLASGDRIRFRFRANFNGYLYVMNHGSSGDYVLLFPAEETGRENRIEAGKEYVVPATKGAFRVTGPPGHDVVYWLVTPMELGAPPYTPLPPPPQPRPTPYNLLPRCDDAVLRARGDCVDSSAGPRQLSKEAPVPENMSGAGAGGDGLVIIRQNTRSVVSSPVPLKGPVLYEFHLAHR